MLVADHLGDGRNRNTTIDQRLDVQGSELMWVDGTADGSHARLTENSLNLPSSDFEYFLRLGDVIASNVVAQIHSQRWL